MAMITHKRSIMTLYGMADDMYCHRVRIVLAEKGVVYEHIELMPDQCAEHLAPINPYHSVPTLVDRDLVLYNADLIMEYLDERFPHPPLLPVYPVARAKNRLMLHHINHDWCSIFDKIHTAKKADADKYRKELKDHLLSIVPLFSDTPYFMSEEFSLLDAALGALFWRLHAAGIELPKEAKPILDYMQRIFQRDSFISSLTEPERALGVGVA